MLNETEIYKDIVKEMATAFFMDKIAGELEELGQGLSNGKNYADYIGETPTVAIYKASQAIGAIEQANNGKGIVELYIEALSADGIEDSLDYRKEFAFSTALQSIGHGVSWFDDHADIDMEMPFYLENDLDIGKSDFEEFDGFDATLLNPEASEIYDDNYPTKTSLYSIHDNIIAGVAKAAILQSNPGNSDNKQTLINALLSNAKENIQAMSFAYKVIGAMQEGNRNILNQLKICNTASSLLPSQYALSDIELKKFSPNANRNDVQIGMLIYDYAVKNIQADALLGFQKPLMSTLDLGLITPTIKRSIDPNQSPSP